MSKTILWPEHGARVHLVDNTVFPAGSKGTIVSGDGTYGLWTVMFDHYGEEATLHVQDFAVDLSPAESAYVLTKRNSTDEFLVNLEELFGGGNPNMTTYRSAVVFELIRLNYYAECACGYAHG